MVDATLAEKYQELVVTYMKGIIKVGRWRNANKMAAATLLEKITFYPTIDLTYKFIKDLNFVPNLSPQNLAAIEIEKEFMLSHGNIKHDFEVQAWAAETALRELTDEAFEKATREKLSMTETRKGSLEESQLKALVEFQEKSRVASKAL
jgi:ABC-type nitrate/sulfonate/bicarbonate transport system substrate-binding protein